MARRRPWYPTPPRTTKTDVSVTRTDDPGLQPRRTNWEQRRADAQVQNTEALSILKQMEGHLGGLLTAARAVPMGDVLFQGAALIGKSGVWHRNYPTAIAAVSVANLSASTLSAVESDSLSGAAPAQGAGITRVAPGRFRTWSARANGLTVYGTPGSTFDVTVYVRPRPPAAGSCGRTSGGILIPAGTTASATATNNGSPLEHIAVVLNVAAIAGGDAVTITINGVTPSGYVYPLLIGTAVTTVSVTPYRIGPSLTPSLNAVSNDLVPETIQVVAAVTGGGTVSYGVDLVAG